MTDKPKPPTLHVGLHKQYPLEDVKDLETDTSGYARQPIAAPAARSEKEQAISDLLIEGMKQGVPDDEMTAWVEARLRERGIEP